RRALSDRQLRKPECFVGRGCPALRGVILVPDRLLFDIGQDLSVESQPERAGRICHRSQGGWKFLVGVVKIVDRQTILLEVILALAAAGRLAGLLDSRQKQGRQDGNDGNDDQQLDQGESRSSPYGRRSPAGCLFLRIQNATHRVLPLLK